MVSLSQTKELFRRAEAVCFDVDSTVIKEEGIDELAKFCGVGDAVTEMYVFSTSKQQIKCIKPATISALLGQKECFILCYFDISGLAKLWVAQ